MVLSSSIEPTTTYPSLISIALLPKLCPTAPNSFFQTKSPSESILATNILALFGMKPVSPICKKPPSSVARMK